MANPLSSLNAEQLNSRTPLTAHRQDKMDPASSAVTPTKYAQSPSKRNDDIIDWDDTPSSPFLTESAASRDASREWRQAVGDVEVDAIFEDPASPEPQSLEAKQTPIQRQIIAEDNKENTQISDTQEKPKKTLSPLKARPSSRPAVGSSVPASRDADFMAMPPPSTKKMTALSSPSRRSPEKVFRIASETPLPKNREPSFEQFGDSIFEDANNRGVDDTNIDDTCFSTFSAVPDMTLFAKMGEANAQSPSRNQTV